MKAFPTPLIVALILTSFFIASPARAEIESYEVGDFQCYFYNAGDEVNEGFSSSKLDWTSEMKDSALAALGYWDSVIANTAAEKVNVAFVWQELGGNILGGATPALGLNHENGLTYTAPEILWREKMTFDSFRSIGSYSNPRFKGENSKNYSIVVRFSSTSVNDFYYGSKIQDIGQQYDFQTVVTHEIGHGMGFFSGATGDGEYGNWTFTFPDGSTPENYLMVTTFDGLMVTQSEDGTTTELLDYELDKERNPIRGEKMDIPIIELSNTYASGTEIFLKDGEENVTDLQVYNPNPFAQGSSMSHVDESTDPDALMQWEIGLGTVRRELTDAELGIMRSMGWKIVAAVPEPALFGLFAGICALVLAGTRRRRKKTA